MLPVQGRLAGTARAAQRLDLAGYEQREVVVFSVRVENPGGTGAPAPAEVARLVRTECRFAP